MKTQSNHLDLPLLETLYPTLECIVSASGEHSTTQFQVTVLIDTGFDDFFSIPKSLAQELNIEFELEQTEIQLGNGDQVTVDVGVCEVKFPFAKESFILKAIIDEDDECLIGIGLLVQLCNSFEIDFENMLIKLKGLKIS
jgi:clan AA aspartic protease